MTRATRIGRLAGLAVGLGIGAALAATPGIASADDIQISFDGMDLFPTAGNEATATTVAGDFGLAIAIGDGANASIDAGSGDYALADGAGSSAVIGQYGASDLSSAVANGTDSSAQVSDGNYDVASATGAHSLAGAGYGNFDIATANGTDSGALASGVIFNNTTLIPGNDDFASAWGPNTIASAGVIVDPSVPTSSSNDVATVFDPFGTVGSDAFAGGGNFDLAAIFGDGFNTELSAVGGNFLTAILPML
jgi:hypothetical protein